jgi:hypothetical protein
VQGAVHPVVIDSAECKEPAGLFATLARELAFPDYFGQNWDALDESLSDLLELSHGGLGSAFGDRPGIRARKLVLTFLDSGRLLDAGEALLTGLIGTLDHATEPNRQHKPAELRVVLQLDPAESAETETELRRITRPRG